MVNKSPDLTAVIAFTSVAMVAVVADVSSPVARALLGLPLVLVLPGYAVTAALPLRSRGSSDRLLFSVGISLSMAALGGVVLNWLPWGLQPRSWACLLGVVTLAATGMALRNAGHALGGGGARPGIALSLREGATVALAIAVVGVAIGTVRTAALREQRAATVVQLWMLPTEDASQNSLRLGIYSNELPQEAYRLELEVGGAVAQEWPMIEPEPGKPWETTVRLPEERPNLWVEATLYRLNAPEIPYRNVVLWPAERPG